MTYTNAYIESEPEFNVPKVRSLLTPMHTYRVSLSLMYLR